MTETTGREMPITQIDELWAIAEKRWGSAGRRNPPPDPRFNELRQALGKVESLFAKDKDREKSSGLGEKLSKPVKRKIATPIDDDDYDPDEIPF